MYNPEQRRRLLRLARDSIHWGLQHANARSVEPHDYESLLQQPRACFVTLHLQHQLRGCIGSLEAYRALVVDVAENAYAAAFRDPRFNPLREDELADLEISISVLTPAQRMEFESEQHLLAQMQPGIDGLILTSGIYKGTFLPAVWEQLPQAEQFLRHLKRKAGLSEDFWSDDVQVSRYHTESFDERSEF